MTVNTNQRTLMCLNLSPLNLQKAIQVLSIKLGIWRIFKLLIKYLTLQVNAKLSVLLFMRLYDDLYKYWSSVSFLPLQLDSCHSEQARISGGANVHFHVRLPTSDSFVLLICPHQRDADVPHSCLWDPNKAGGKRWNLQGAALSRSVMRFPPVGREKDCASKGLDGSRWALPRAWALSGLQRALSQGETGNTRSLSAHNSSWLRKSRPCYHFAQESRKVKLSPI